MKQAVNPYLPGYEYIPDGEPYEFDGRVYVYGSHDRFHAPVFCMNDYVCWSAPVEDLSDWRYEGVIYRKNQDPKNKWGLRLLFAPDVEKGADGRYYLFYAFDAMGIMGVAVCDTPAGAYTFYGHVHYADGTVWGRRKGDAFPFDPGVLVDDDGRVYLYAGYYTRVPSFATGGKRLSYEGGYVLELETDMVTIRMPQKLLFPKKGSGAYQNHEFFEASSIRKYEGKYYFVYSSACNHELCYAVSDKPTEGFQYGGVLISNGDIGLSQDGKIREEKDALNYIGNNHGGMLYLKGSYYIFYHRHTDRTSYSRQTCAEKLRRNPDGSFCQAEMTSSGLHGRLLAGTGRYESRIACNLWSRNGAGRIDVLWSKLKYRQHPYFTQDKKDGDTQAIQYIANMRHGAVAGFKYFDFADASRMDENEILTEDEILPDKEALIKKETLTEKEIMVENPQDKKKCRAIQIEVSGHGTGEMLVATDAAFQNVAARVIIQVKGSKILTEKVPLQVSSGKQALYFQYIGTGHIDFYGFTLFHQ